MYAILIQLLKSPYTWLIGIILGLLVFYNIKIYTLEITVQKQEIAIERVTQNYHTCTSNFEDTLNANKNNTEVIEKMKKDNSLTIKAYENILLDKDGLLDKLRKNMLEMKRPIVYPTEIVYKECKIKIKENDGSSKVLNDLNLIGK